jgi:hypothetical protein
MQKMKKMQKTYEDFVKMAMKNNLHITDYTLVSVDEDFLKVKLRFNFMRMAVQSIIIRVITATVFGVVFGIALGGAMWTRKR